MLLSLIAGFEVSPQLRMQLVVVAVWLIAIVLLAEGVHRSRWNDPELVRKLVHIGTGNIILLAWWLQVPMWIGVAASGIASAIALLSYRIPILPSINSVGRKSLGTFFYAVSFGVLIGTFWARYPHYAVLGILVMTWGDGLAAVVGQRWGRHPYKLWDTQKSWEGSLTMAGVSFGVSAALLLAVQGAIWQTWAVSLVVAGVAAGLEAFSKYGIDNLTVPIGSALIGFWLNEGWLGAIATTIQGGHSSLFK